MDKVYKALDVAAYCVNRCIDLERAVSNLQLQKILYYVQANFLCKYNRRCFGEEIIHWQYGPVVKEVYDKYKSNVASPIKTKVHSYSYLTVVNDKFEEKEQKIEEIDILDVKLINDVCDKFSKRTASQLIDLTHEEDPWKNTDYNDIITTESIKEYFKTHEDRL